MNPMQKFYEWRLRSINGDIGRLETEVHDSITDLNSGSGIISAGINFTLIRNHHRYDEIRKLQAKRTEIQQKLNTYKPGEENA